MPCHSWSRLKLRISRSRKFWNLVLVQIQTNATIVLGVCGWLFFKFHVNQNFWKNLVSETVHFRILKFLFWNSDLFLPQEIDTLSNILWVTWKQYFSGQWQGTHCLHWRMELHQTPSPYVDIWVIGLPTLQGFSHSLQGFVPSYRSSWKNHQSVGKLPLTVCPSLLLSLLGKGSQSERLHTLRGFLLPQNKGGSELCLHILQ